MEYISNIVIDEEYTNDNKHIAKYNHNTRLSEELKEAVA